MADRISQLNGVLPPPLFPGIINRLKQNTSSVKRVGWVFLTKQVKCQKCHLKCIYNA
ncbi:hypothetical protein HanIR_Chr05g0226191 [Helianthus annuus]|nr:hypothetical protein HanIR_Chr05g0226191 [Helianthus annuus]